MKAIHIHTTYGKNHKYIASEWVLDSYVEEYKENMVKQYREWGWTKDFHFTSPMRPEDLADNPTGGTIFVQTKEGGKVMRTRL